MMFRLPQRVQKLKDTSMTWLPRVKKAIKSRAFTILNSSIEEEIAKATNNLMKDAGILTTESFEAEDIFVAGYPKSGNTWFQNLVAGIQYGIDLNKTPHRLVNDLVPDVHDLYYRRYSSPTVFKTHARPKPYYHRVIYLIRDGRDVMVSYYHHLQGQKREADWLELVHKENLMGGLWHEHVEEWLSNPYKADMITIRYEDLLKNPLPELQKFCEFANFPMGHKELEKVIEGASFQGMRRREEEQGIHIRGWKNESFFVRKGQSGTYRDEMPTEALEAFMAVAGKTMNRLGYIDAEEGLK